MFEFYCIIEVFLILFSKLCQFIYAFLISGRGETDENY